MLFQTSLLQALENHMELKIHWQPCRRNVNILDKTKYLCFIYGPLKSLYYNHSRSDVCFFYLLNANFLEI